LPDDKLGVVAVTTKDSSNAVMNHIAHEALKLMLAVRAGNHCRRFRLRGPSIPPRHAT